MSLRAQGPCRWQWVGLVSKGQRLQPLLPCGRDPVPDSSGLTVLMTAALRLFHRTPPWELSEPRPWEVPGGLALWPLWVTPL